jgi:hypothetical protein
MADSCPSPPPPSAALVVQAGLHRALVLFDVEGRVDEAIAAAETVYKAAEVAINRRDEAQVGSIAAKHAQLLYAAPSHSVSREIMVLVSVIVDEAIAAAETVYKAAEIAINRRDEAQVGSIAAKHAQLLYAAPSQ